MQTNAYHTVYLQQVQRAIHPRSGVGVLLDPVPIFCSSRTRSFFLYLGINDNGFGFSYSYFHAAYVLILCVCLFFCYASFQQDHIFRFCYIIFFTAVCQDM